MSQRVLDVGQCSPDHAAIVRLIERQFDAEVVRADQLDDTLVELARGPVALVLINRKLDIDYSDGMNILAHLKANARYAAIPVMLVTNYPEHQAAAIAAGAEPGFGKAQLGSPDTLTRLGKFLSLRS